MGNVKEDTGMECLPYTSFSDMMSDRGYTNFLMRPVTRFFNKTEELVRPLRQTLKGLRSQLLLDLQDDLFGDTLENIWKDNNLRYIGMLLLIPRLLCLLVLMFGCLASSLFVCQMRIFQCIEPKNIVSAYGKIGLFSVVYVLGCVRIDDARRNI